MWADCCPALSSARQNEGAGRVCSTLYLLHCVVCECGGRGVSVFSPVCNLLSLQCTGVQFMSANGGCLSFLQCADYSVFAVAVHECFLQSADYTCSMWCIQLQCMNASTVKGGAASDVLSDLLLTLPYSPLLPAHTTTRFFSPKIKTVVFRLSFNPFNPIFLPFSLKISATCGSIVCVGKMSLRC